MVLERPLAVAFIHPDLGLGGAERLVVDAALELSARGHAVSRAAGSSVIWCSPPALLPEAALLWRSRRRAVQARLAPAAQRHAAAATAAHRACARP